MVKRSQLAGFAVAIVVCGAICVAVLGLVGLGEKLGEIKCRLELAREVKHG